MIPNTVLVLELNPTQSNSSKLVVNLWVAETTNKLTDTTLESEPLSKKLTQNPVLHIKPDGDLDHHQVVQVSSGLIGNTGICIDLIDSGLLSIMLLENKLITTKSQNPTFTGERAGDIANNL